MGDIAEMMLDGTLCECCGCFLHGQGQGFPRRCFDCKPTKAERKAENMARHAATQAQQVKGKCPTCGKRVRLVGMADHMKDAHGAARQTKEGGAA